MSRFKHLRWIAVLAVAGAFLLIGRTMNTNPPTNRAQTSPDASEDVRTRVYSAPLNEVAAKVRALRLSTYGRGWQTRPGDAQSEVVFRVPVIVFSDVLTVSLHAQGQNETRVDVESHSLVGQGDFGENRRHIRQILRALDAVLKRA